MMNEIITKLGEIEMKDWISIIAVLVSPLIAVSVTVWLEKRRQKRKDKMELFQALMTQRGINESYAWVNALNSIHIIFSDDKEVIDALEAFLDTTNVKNPEDMDLVSFDNKKVKLLEVMAKSLGYSKNINWGQIKSPYVPRWMSQEQAFNSIMKEAQLKYAENILNGQSIDSAAKQLETTVQEN